MDPATYFYWHSGLYRHNFPVKGHTHGGPKSPRMREKRPIKVFIRVRPFNDEEKERDEASALEIYKEESRIKVLDERHSLETSYFFDGVFGAEDDNQRVYTVTAKPLVNKLLNGINCALLTYGQTGTGKTHTVLAEGSVTNFTINHLFERITQDVAHRYKVTCSFVQVYQDKVYDLLSPESKDELFVREHPKKGIYVNNLSHHSVKSAEGTLELLSEGRKELIIAETRMVRQSSRSHAIFQISIERRLDPTRDRSKRIAPVTQGDMNSSCEFEDCDEYTMTLEEDIILRGKIDICDLAGSERLGKTMAEGVRLSEAKHINSSLLELGNVIYALSEGTRRHIPFRNSTLTRLLQECLGPQCRTSFIVCVAPTASEAYETRCSLNFGTRARKITNKERLILNVEVDYKILSKRLARRIECLEQQLDKSGVPEEVSFDRAEVEAPISVETQTEMVLAELQDIVAEGNKNDEILQKFITLPQVEILIISEIMTSICNNTQEPGTINFNDVFCNAVTTLLHDLLDVISAQHQDYTLTEDHWAEVDLKQILTDSMDDLDLMREAVTVDADASFQTNDITKYAEYLCTQFEERCLKMEEDMKYCLEKFQDVMAFDDDANLHQKMKKLVEFLDNNRNAEMPEIANHNAAGFDIEFLSWLISVHMALRLTLVLLYVNKAEKVPKLDPCETTKKEDAEEVHRMMNETFESITSINEDSTLEELEHSFVNFNSYSNLASRHSDDSYANASTPKRGHFVPLSIQNHLYHTKSDKLPYSSRDASFKKLQGYGKNIGHLESNFWSNRGNLDVSLASDASEIDSIDGTFDDLEISHEQRMKHRRLLDNNVSKLEEKCELLEDKNSKLMRTLNVIMRENKDVNEKLRLLQMEKTKTARELEDLDHKLGKVMADKNGLERNYTELQKEKKRLDRDAMKLNTENHQIQIQVHGFQRQISLKDGENESLRQQIAELRTEQTASKEEREALNKQIEEATEKCNIGDQKITDLLKERKGMLDEVRALCGMLEKSALEAAGEDVVAVPSRSRSKSIGDDSEATFETELFVAIENNIRIEGIVNDVKARLDVMAGFGKEESKTVSEGVKKEGVKIVEPKGAGKPAKSKLPTKNRSGETRSSALRRAKSLRNEVGRRSVVVNKESDSIVPRGSKIKELMNEKLKIEQNYKELSVKSEKLDEELKTAKSQIEMLVRECGALDHEVARMRNGGSNQEVDHRSKFSIEKASDKTGSSEDSLFLRTKDIDKLGERHEELRKNFEASENKLRELEAELDACKDENLAVKRDARAAERKYEEVRCELQHYEGQNYSQKIENSRLRDHVIQLSQELNREQQRIEQLGNKHSAAKERNAMQIRKLEGELLKCVKKLDRYRDRERERRQQIKRMESTGKDSSEADSGLMPDHSDENVDLT